jgi:hypothetical protein
MKPFNSGKPIALWLLRIALFGILTSIYLNTATTLNFINFNFYISVFMILSGVILFYSALFSKQGLTILAGLFIFTGSLYKLFVSFNGSFDAYFLAHLVPLSIGFYFFTNGNET